MVEIERLVMEFLREKGYWVIHEPRYNRFRVIKVTRGEHFETQILLAIYTIVGDKICIMYAKFHPKPFSIYSKEDFAKMLKFLKQRERDSADVMHSTSTGWDTQHYTAV